MSKTYVLWCEGKCDRPMVHHFTRPLKDQLGGRMFYVFACQKCNRERFYGCEELALAEEMAA